ncbi:hypothetical protein L596_017881 [Steinernema carpocapsae]|uniref:DUF38 domain-containing protein n=1 Tax=Steinernema carpocapsae TaxID=34508 RepID=A0A4V6A1V4_STECR|nr:hypothetical protein L596_017881 [Steinernema carpocapsae]
MYFYALKGPISNKKFQPTNLRKWTNLEERGNFYLTNFSISGRANPLEPPPDHERCDPENALRFARLLAYDMRGTEMKMYFFDRENEEFVGKLVSCLNTQFKTVKILTMSGLGRHLETYVRRLVEAGCVKKLRVEMCEITQGFLDQMKLLFVQSQIEHIKINCSIKPEAEFFIEMVEFWKATPLPHCKYVITSKMAEFAVEDGEMIWTQLCSKYGAPVEEKLITIEHVGEIRSLRIKKAFRSELITLQVVRCWKTLKEGKICFFRVRS